MPRNFSGIRDIKTRIFETVITTILLGILGAAVSTYTEVKMLRRDVDRLEKSVNDLWIQANHEVQRLEQEKRDK